MVDPAQATLCGIHRLPWNIRKPETFPHRHYVPTGRGLSGCFVSTDIRSQRRRIGHPVFRTPGLAPGASFPSFDLPRHLDAFEILAQ